MSYVIGIDLGTSSLKGLVVNKQGNVLLQAVRSYSLSHPELGYSEQNPKEWLKAIDEVLTELMNKMPELANELEGISFSGQMHSLVLLDEDQIPLRDAILWNDVRTTKQCEYITEVLGDSLLEKTKNIALEGFTLPKILWVMENEPTIWSKVEKLLLPKDYLVYHLTGNLYSEYSDASGTLLLNLATGQWDQEILATFKIEESKLPELLESTASGGTLTSELKEKFGFKNEVQIFLGGADNACAALASGIIDKKRGMASIGTSGVFLSYEGASLKNYQGQLHFFNHVLANTYYSMGVTLAAGQSLTWLKETLGEQYSFEELLALASKSPIGAKGLLFSPFIMGERTPYVDSKIRGSFLGIDASHDFSDFCRAVVEGITMSLRESQLILEKEATHCFEEIISVGGGAKSDLWLQIQADVFRTKIKTLKVEQGPGYGAAMIAALGLAWFETPEDCVASFVSYDREFLPIENNVTYYDKLFSIYNKVYLKTKEISHELLELQLLNK